MCFKVTYDPETDSQVIILQFFNFFETQYLYKGNSHETQNLMFVECKSVVKNYEKTLARDLETSMRSSSRMLFLKH